MSKLTLGLRLHIIYLRWIILLTLFLIHVHWDLGHSVGYVTLITFNVLFTWMHFNKFKKSIWRSAILLEVIVLFILNCILSLELPQLLYLYSTLLIAGILFTKKESLLIAFIYSVLASFLTYVFFQKNEGFYSLFFVWGFIFYLLLTILVGNVSIFVKKTITLLHYTEKISSIPSMKTLHDWTGVYIKKLLNVSKCYLCMYENCSVIDDWSIQYYTRILLSNPDYRTNPKEQVIRLESYLGDLEAFLLIPIRGEKGSEHVGGILIPMKKTQPNKIDMILLRMVISSFLNQWNSFVFRQGQAISMKDEVRHKTAQDIHDGLAQQLFFLSAQIFQIKNHLSKGRVEVIGDLVEAMEQQASSCQSEVRSLITQLKGEKRESNIHDAIQKLVYRLTYQTSVQMNLECKGNFSEESVEIEEAVYRFLEEAINNILKHAQATSINILVEITSVQWTLKIIDDGIGFDHKSMIKPKPQSYGLVGLRERVENLGGQFTLRSTLGNGTELVAIIPRGGLKGYV